MGKIYKAIFVKEWLKIRWVYLILALVNVLVITAIYLKINQAINFRNAATIWFSAIIMKIIFYSDFKYISLFSGLLLGFFQFIPEALSNRLKLSLHLPLKENTVIGYMLSVGIGSLLCIYLVDSILLGIFINIIFPFEVYKTSIITIVPWFLAGIIAYLSAAIVSIEPFWQRRILTIIIFTGFTDFLMFTSDYGSYLYAIPWLILLIILLSQISLLSGFRFKRGGD